MDIIRSGDLLTEAPCFVERKVDTVRFFVRCNGEDIKFRTKRLAEDMARIVNCPVVEKHTFKVLRPGGQNYSEVQEIVYTHHLHIAN